MKKLMMLFAVTGAFTFASCDSPSENAAEEHAEQVEEVTEDTEIEPIEEAGDDYEDSVDMAH